MAALESYLAVNPALIFNGPPRVPATARRDRDPREATLSILRDQATAISQRAEKENRPITEAEHSAIDAIFAAFARTETELSGQESEPDPMAVSMGRKTQPDDVGFRMGRREPEPELRPTNLPPGPEGRRFNDLFPQRRNSPADELKPGEFLNLLTQGLNDPRLIQASQSEGEGGAGGFEVPVQLVRAIFDGGLGQEVVRPRCTIYPMGSNSLTIPIANVFDRSSSVGGITSKWVAENTESDLQTGALTQITMRAKKLMILVALSNEVIADSLSGGQIFADLMAGSLAYDLDAALIGGTGAGQPLGMLNADSVIVAAKESGQGADTFSFPNVVQCWARLHPRAASNSVWYVSTGVIPQLMQMSFDEGATDKQPIFTVSGTASAPQMTLMGRPIIPTEHNAILGDAGDVLLCDPSKFAVGVRLGMMLDRSVHIRFTSDQSVFRLIFRCDSAPLWPTVITPRSGSATLSWAVSLAARA
jgi:HK97 family phage major capsid protein